MNDQSDPWSFLLAGSAGSLLFCLRFSTPLHHFWVLLPVWLYETYIKKGYEAYKPSDSWNNDRTAKTTTSAAEDETPAYQPSTAPSGSGYIIADPSTTTKIRDTDTNEFTPQSHDILTNSQTNDFDIDDTDTTTQKCGFVGAVHQCVCNLTFKTREKAMA